MFCHYYFWNHAKSRFCHYTFILNFENSPFRTQIQIQQPKKLPENKYQKFRIQNLITTERYWDRYYSSLFFLIKPQNLIGTIFISFAGTRGGEGKVFDNREKTDRRELREIHETSTRETQRDRERSGGTGSS